MCLEEQGGQGTELWGVGIVLVIDAVNSNFPGVNSTEVRRSDLDEILPAKHWALLHISVLYGAVLHSRVYWGRVGY